ncbi:MAG: Rrf2 family transcriptional regulator [Candidatus Shapirobacteria bacterium]|nr:Rrf2 family transcriptional regulator [Candidatus Shapirobacteria bacterium]
MISISKKIEYSIIFISYLSKRQGEIVSLTSAAEKLVLPYRFLGQIASFLRSSGIVESKEGKMGGYFLAADFKNKSLYDLVEALGENKHLVECLSDKGCKRLNVCAIASIWNRIEIGMFNEMKKVKLSEI